jgi:hypothetical protein
MVRAGFLLSWMFYYCSFCLFVVVCRCLTPSRPFQSKKESILDLNQHLNKEILVKFNGGREGLSLSLLSFRLFG